MSSNFFGRKPGAGAAGGAGGGAQAAKPPRQLPWVEK